jgi:hypothetical protein
MDAHLSLQNESPSVSPGKSYITGALNPMKNALLMTGKQMTPRAKWGGWLPLAILPSLALMAHESVAPWNFMWMMAVAIFAGCKWWTWRQTISRGIETTAFRSMAFLFLWPGMNADCFLALNPSLAKPGARSWIFASAKALFGATLLWGVARLFGKGWSAGWIGMIGLIFVLHFGVFHLLALFWQRNGINAQALMRWPVLAQSLGDFWGRRWNAGFRDFAFGLLFVRLSEYVPPRLAILMVFLASGLIHELVITVPAGGGYGLPTLYFAIQGVGLLFERSRLGTRLGLRRGIPGRIFALAVVALPIFAVFPEPFVLRVMVPFFQVIGALP